MTPEILSLLQTLPDKVIATIKAMSDKQRAPRPICLDSIALVLGISIKDLAPIIDYLQKEGKLTIHINEKSGSRKPSMPDSVSLT